MVLDKLGCNFLGNAFHAVLKDLAIILLRLNEFGTVTVEKHGSCLCNSEPSFGTRPQKQTQDWSSHFL